MYTEEDLNLIDQYFKKELSGEELARFEERLGEDPTFLQEVELQKKIISNIKEAEFLNIIREVHFNVINEELTGFKKSAEPAKLYLSSNTLASREKIPQNPELLGQFSINYEGVQYPSFQVNVSSGKPLFDFVKIYQPTLDYFFHYRLEVLPDKNMWLNLYGEFDPQNLTLLYTRRNSKDYFKLRIGTKIYPLKVNKSIVPLSKKDLPNKWMIIGRGLI